MDLCYIRKCPFRKYCLNLQQKSDMKIMNKIFRLVVVLFSAKIAEVATALAILGSMEGQCYFEKSCTCNDTLLII